MNQTSVRIDRLALGGDGVARLPAPSGGPVVFVPFSAPEDMVTLEGLQKESSFYRGSIARLDTPSPQRVEPRCPLFFRPGRSPRDCCGGCDWQHLSGQAQRTAKRILLTETLQRIGKISRPPVEETRGPASPDGEWGYRNKGLVPFAHDGAGRLVAGFFAPASHRVVTLTSCPVQNHRFDATLASARLWLETVDAPVYDSSSQRGWLRHILIRTFSTGQTLAALVTTSHRGPDVAAFGQELRKNCPFVSSVYHNINDRAGNAVLGPRWKHVAGLTHMEESILGLRFRLSPGSFFQVNHAVAEILYQLAIDMADPQPNDVAWELYAGVGAMGQLLAKRCRLVWAVEENAQAVRDGIESLPLNGIANLRFRQAPCEAALRRGWINETPDIVVLDPPRAGCEEGVLRQVMKRRPRRVIYVSCDPGTLARDARYLCTGGYLLKRAVPVDMFPQTAHIESVSLFERVGP